MDDTIPSGSPVSSCVGLANSNSLPPQSWLSRFALIGCENGKPPARSARCDSGGGGRDRSSVFSPNRRKSERKRAARTSSCGRSSLASACRLASSASSRSGSTSGWTPERMATPWPTRHSTMATAPWTGGYRGPSTPCASAGAVARGVILAANRIGVCRGSVCATQAVSYE